MATTLRFNQTINVPRAVVYKAFTHPNLLDQWLCSGAQVDLREGGFFFYTWNEGFYIAGIFQTLEKNSRIVQSWRVMYEPIGSTMETVLTGDGDVTHVEVIMHIDHDGRFDGTEEGWRRSLGDLKYLLETGFDQRLMTRPMLGIYPGGLDDERAARLGLTGVKGVYINDVIAGMGAASVLQHDDVLVSLGGMPVTDFPSLQTAVGRHKGGDVVPVEFYRAGSKHSADMLLSKRPVPELPATPSALAEVLRGQLAELRGELDTLLAGVPDSVTSSRPNPTEWSVNDNLAHLLWTERTYQGWLFNIVGGNGQIVWMDNNDLHLVMSTAVYPTTADLVTEWERSLAAIIAEVEALPADFAAIKPFFNLIAFGLTNDERHTREHFEQIRRTIAAITQPTT